jgi:hypothetical protein
MAQQLNREVESHCPRCGAVGAGRFCNECGAPLRDAPCRACGKTLAPGAHFCFHCGTAVVAGEQPRAASARPQATPAKLFAIVTLLVIAAFIAGEAAGRWSAPPTRQAVDQAGSTEVPRAGVAPDISSMSPQERASRLFNRVMTYSERGQSDSARFFAPMAIQAYQMIGPLDAHARYDIGAISVAAGDAAAARAQADTILAAQPNHLLGLVLAIHAADLARDSAGAARFRRRLIAAVPAERAKGLKEYDEHARDIDDAVTKAGGRR